MQVTINGKTHDVQAEAGTALVTAGPCRRPAGKVPRHFVFVGDLPRNALGKVQHFRLRELAAS